MTSICHLDSYSKSVSELTGRTIYVNNSLDQYLISPDWQPELILKVVKQWKVRVGELSAVHRPPPGQQQAVIALAECTTRGEFCDQLNAVLLSEFKDKFATSSIATKQRFLVELMLALWSVSAVAWPAKLQEPFSQPLLGLKNRGFIGPQTKFLLPIRDYLSKGSTDDANNFRFILDHLLARVGIVEIGDITPATFYLVKARTRSTKMRSPGMSAVLNVMRDTYTDQQIFWTIEDFGFSLSKLGPLTRDDNFQWVLSKAPDLERWAQLARIHIATTPSNYRKRKSSINLFMEYLLENPLVSRCPSEYFSIRNKPGVSFNVDGNKGRQTMHCIHEFLNEALLKTCSQTDDNELPILMPGFAVPLPKPVYRGVNKGETHRETMPTRLISQAMRILTENKFSWAKEVGRTSDTFRRKHPETKKFENVWSPVRTFALLIKLLLPARTHQVRHVDSGEGDTDRYKNNGKWCRNKGPHSPSGKTPVQNGVFRKYKRKDGSEGAIIYFNTNKTADIDSIVKGFVMPWEKLDALKIFSELRDWQEMYNPVMNPTAWTDIQELKKTKHKDDLLKMGSSYFLFRDPCNRYRSDMPVTDIRIRKLWLRLMDELECRLATSGETLENGQPIKLILTRDKHGLATSAVFDLHTLRVTMITAMYEEGVPPEYLMKIVGHATVLMTLYYTKLNAETLSLRMDDAVLARQHKAQSEMVGFIQTASRPELESALAFRHTSSLDTVTDSTGASLLIMDHGICPVSGKRCHEGLAVTDAAALVTRYLPVPGGSTNCVRCRFFITGPAFLFGLAAHVNDLTYRLKRSSFSFEKSQVAFDAISDQYASMLELGEPFHLQRNLQIAETVFESATAEVDSIALSLQTAYALTEQCIRISNRSKDADNKFSLVVVGGVGQIDAIFSEGHEFEQLHQICKDATLFDGLKINWQQPNLERARLFDRMLRNSGYEPRFFLLDDADALKIANEMGQFLYTRLKKEDVHYLIDGRTTLRALGFEKAFISQLETIVPTKLHGVSKLLKVRE